jgi:hypothetical protein
MLLGWAALASCQPQQVVIPSDLTVKAAPGAPGLSTEAAEEFLKRAPFPNVGKTPLHEGLCYAEPFYHDAALDPAGRDADAVNGVDSATLFFNASLGTAETWLAMPHGRDPAMCPQSAAETHVVDPKRMKLGNGQGTGTDCGTSGSAPRASSPTGRGSVRVTLRISAVPRASTARRTRCS